LNAYYRPMNTETILLVEDDRLVLFTIAQGLRAAGYSVIEADSGESALEICKNFTPDLAILDMRMKTVSGLDVAKWLNENIPTPFLFLSAYDDHDTVKAATSSGAMSYLVKPVSVPQILPSIRTALARCKEIRKLKDSEQNLTHALNSNREISVAIGILMERRNIGQQKSFELIRQSARDRRRKTTEMAAEIINGSFDT
jgi:two-component system, response regulator PdtaR